MDNNILRPEQAHAINGVPGRRRATGLHREMGRKDNQGAAMKILGYTRTYAAGRELARAKGYAYAHVVTSGNAPLTYCVMVDYGAPTEAPTTDAEVETYLASKV